MNVSFPINRLLDKGLTADDYTIGMLIKEKKYGLLKKYNEIIKHEFYNSIKRLKNKGYIKSSNHIGDIIPIKELKITDEFIDIIVDDDIFEEFYENYPLKVKRPDGSEDYLRLYKNKCKLKYKRITHDSRLTHDHLVDCLKFELANREKTKTMAYMKRMSNWLDSEEWKKYEDNLSRIEESQELLQRKKYGTDLL